MAIILVKNGTADEYSYGDGTDPISFTDTLTDSGSPSTIDSSIVHTQIKASTYLYSNIAVTIVNEQTGMDYKLSLNQTNWFDSLTSGAGGDTVGQIANMDGTTGDKTEDVYIKCVVANDGSVSSGTKTTPDVRLAWTENQ